jgi:hypothetical protein
VICEGKDIAETPSSAASNSASYGSTTQPTYLLKGPSEIKKKKES